MKLPLQQLTRHFAGSRPAPVYLVTGDELLLQQEAADRIRTAALTLGFSERVRIPAETADWGKTLHASAHSLSLFAEKRLLELDLRQTKCLPANTAFIRAHAENPPPNTLLLLLAGRMDARAEQSAWCRAIDRCGVIVPVWPVSREQLPQWIIQRAAEKNLALAPGDAQWLSEQMEGNLLAIAQTIEKLALWQGKATGTAQHPDGQANQQTSLAAINGKALRDMLVASTRFDVFLLTDAVVAGQTARATTILHSLLTTGTEPILILWALARELRIVARLARDTARGVPLSAAFNTLMIREKRKPLLRTCLGRMTAEDCGDLLKKAAHMDRLIKGAEKGRVQDVLEELVMAFATGKKIALP